MPDGELDPPSPFVLAHRSVLEAAASRGVSLDLACGRGRHALLLAEWGARVVAVDRSDDALRSLRRVASATARGGALQALRADAEDPGGLPIREESISLLVITRFLHRPACARFAALLRPGGVVVYETFLARQRELGRGPRRREFLLEDDELPTLFPTLEVVDHREGFRDAPQEEWVAGLVARKPVAP